LVKKNKKTSKTPLRISEYFDRFLKIMVTGMHVYFFKKHEKSRFVKIFVTPKDFKTFGSPEK